MLNGLMKGLPSCVMVNALRDGQCFDGRMRFTPAFSWKGLDRILDILRKHQVIPKDKQYRFNFDSDKIVAMKRA